MKPLRSIAISCIAICLLVSPTEAAPRKPHHKLTDAELQNAMRSYVVTFGAQWAEISDLMREAARRLGERKACGEAVPPPEDK